MSKRWLSSGEWFGDLGKLALRIVFGGGMLFLHGLPKLMSWSEKSATFPDPLGVGSSTSLGLAVFAEAFAAALVLIGALTRFALIPLLVTMAVAFLVIHGADPFAKKELSLLYFGAFTTLFFVGPGRLSVDVFIGKAAQSK